MSSDTAIGFKLTAEANATADEVMRCGLFPDAITVARYAFAYAVKSCYDGIRDPVSYSIDRAPSGSNYNFGSVDADRFMTTLVQQLYPALTTDAEAAQAVRGLMLFGMCKMAEAVRDGRTFQFSDIM